MSEGESKKEGAGENVSTRRTIAIAAGSRLQLELEAIDGRVEVAVNGAPWFSSDHPTGAHHRLLDSGVTHVDMSASPSPGGHLRAVLLWTIHDRAGDATTHSRFVLDAQRPGETLRLAVSS